MGLERLLRGRHCWGAGGEVGRGAAGGRQEGVGDGFGVELEGEGDPGEGYGCQQQRRGVKRIRGGA